MTNQHPATPASQEINKLFMLPLGEEERVIAAFCAGADQELEACVNWLDDTDCEDPREVAQRLRAARRPKPPSLKKQALAQLREVNAMLQFQTTGGETSAIRRALEALDD